MPSTPHLRVPPVLWALVAIGVLSAWFAAWFAVGGPEEIAVSVMAGVVCLVALGG